MSGSLTTPGESQPAPDGGPSRGQSRPSPQPADPDCTALCERGGYAVAVVPDLTLEDIASFRPAAPTLTGQPAGYGVVGMPANLVAAASEQQFAGNVLGWDVVVRFVPTAFVFDYGDGTSGRTRTGGATWESLGQAQFTPTATSHAYRARGTYPVSVTVEYTPSVSFGAAFRPIPGVVSASSGGYEVRVVEVRTALVERTCLEDPAGQGC
ncbi:hypothetical protein [Microbacterium sp. SS28]|uniref:hypothetical protein n=1 Tax=Microbacterium sp. SS28 TaxID=2919948 RepID=UPI001FA9A9BB|nr:hypothetical protein [Microbacterium sp. SS28]